MEHEMYDVVESMNKAPVRVGEVLESIPTGSSKEDPYLCVHGYIVFIKGMPSELINEVIKVRVTATKPRFGFAQFIGRGDA